MPRELSKWMPGSCSPTSWAPFPSPHPSPMPLGEQLNCRWTPQTSASLQTQPASLPRHAALQGCWGLWGLACWELHRPRQARHLPSPAQVQTSARTCLPSRAVGQACSLTVGPAAACVLGLSACSPGLSAVVQDGSVLQATMGQVERPQPTNCPVALSQGKACFHTLPV